MPIALTKASRRLIARPVPATHSRRGMFRVSSCAATITPRSALRLGGLGPLARHLANRRREAEASACSTQAASRCRSSTPPPSRAGDVDHLYRARDRARRLRLTRCRPCSKACMGRSPPLGTVERDVPMGRATRHPATSSDDAAMRGFKVEGGRRRIPVWPPTGGGANHEARPGDEPTTSRGAWHFPTSVRRARR
jgi:hypothetical protein